ncbi:MAG: hypothetical protein J6K14_01310 [Clostridia bacterium]|nr:hypothetical protein [Clostridia bacterium]
MNGKRITIFSGHYGSGKTNIALTYALAERAKGKRVAIADIDIVNPYFRTKDSEAMLAEHGIRLICSEYANTNIDIPALPQDIYAIVDDRSLTCILDVGGDERGALALGRIAPAIREEDDYDMIFVANRYRPLTATVEGAMEVLHEIEAACGLRFTAIVNNSNLGAETTAEDVLSSVAFGEALSKASGLPLVATAVTEPLARALSGRMAGLYPIRLQKHL